MKAVITKVGFRKEFESKFGTLYGFQIEYDGKKAFYSSKKREQDKFVEGKEAEFEEEKMQGKNGEWIKIKPAQKAGFSNFGRAVKKEQSKYSGFAMAYAKDLVVSGHIDIKNMFPMAGEMLNWMVEQDKNLDK